MPGTPVLAGPTRPELDIRVTHEVATARSSPVTTITVAGDLDGVGGPRLQSLWDAGPSWSADQVHLDLTRVGHCDAEGLRVLTRVLATRRDQGRQLELSVRGVVAWLVQLFDLGAGPGVHVICGARTAGRPG